MKYKEYDFTDAQRLSCLLKYKYSSEELAWHDIYYRELPERDLTIYKCKVCNGYHITTRF